MSERKFVSYVTFDNAEERTIVADGNGSAGEVMAIVHHGKRTIFIDPNYRAIFDRGDLMEAIPVRAIGYTRVDLSGKKEEGVDEHKVYSAAERLRGDDPAQATPIPSPEPAKKIADVVQHD